MLFSKEALVQTLRKNFNYKLVNDKIFGNLIELDTRIAYRLCLTTNTYYLNDKYGLRLFGRFITYNHRNFSLNQGLFLLNPRTQKFSESQPLVLFKQFPFIYRGAKKLIFVDSQITHEIIQRKFETISSAGLNPEDYIVNLIHRDGSQWEHYFEFMASEYFIKNGYFTDIQLPWSYHGRPDFGIYKHPNIDILKSMGLIKCGALILELSALRLFNKIDFNFNNINNSDNGAYDEFVVGEVKTKQTKTRILEYLKTGLPFRGYEFIPNKENREVFCGLIKIDENNIIQIQKSPENKYINYEKIQEDSDWFNCYLKIHLLGNLYSSEIQDLMSQQINESLLNFTNLNKLVKKVNALTILKRIKDGI